MSDQEATSKPAETPAEPTPTTDEILPSGQPPSGQPPSGQAASDQAASDQAASDQAASGQAGDANAATVASETSPAGARPSYVFLGVITMISLVLDLWSKHWAKAHFEALRPRGNRQLVVIEDMVSLIFAKNRGGAWGLLQNETEALRRPFFLIVSVAAIVFIVSLYRKLHPGQTALKWGLPLVLGGALGNLVDRIRYGYVVDFIDVYMKVDGGVKHWPTFNIADVAICIGVGLMAVDMFTSRSAPKSTATAATTTTPAVPPAATTGDAAAGGATPGTSAAGAETAAPEGQPTALAEGALAEGAVPQEGGGPNPATPAEGT